MNAIVAVDANWGIGFEGGLLVRIPEDMKLFRQMTTGKVVVMGRGTFESLPGRKPLQDRVNIVLSTSMPFQNKEVDICRSLDALSLELKKYLAGDVFVIGGESVYTQLLPYCARAYVTRIEQTYRTDRHFVNLDQDERWKLVLEGEAKCYQGIQYRFLTYSNTSIDANVNTRIDGNINRDININGKTK